MGGGLPNLLQYYKGEGGVSWDPKFVLRNIWTAPYIFFAPIPSIQQYPIVLAKLEWLMMAQNPPGPDLHIFVWLLPYVPRSKQDIYSVCNSTFPDSKETFLIEVNPPPPCLTISCRQGFSHPLPKPR